MKVLLKLEEGAKFIMAFWLSQFLVFSWWVYWVCFLIPYISILAYLVNSKTGAWVYNLFHRQGLAIVIGLTGYFFQNAGLQLAGLILFGYSSFDRILGYGLKYSDNFKHTHLGIIGNEK